MADSLGNRYLPNIVDQLWHISLPDRKNLYNYTLLLKEDLQCDLLRHPIPLELPKM
jgi:hypothetical protein